MEPAIDTCTTWLEVLAYSDSKNLMDLNQQENAPSIKFIFYFIKDEQQIVKQLKDISK